MSYNPYSLEGKTILVTGASSGIGRATAIECSKMGATIIATGRNEERLNETAASLDMSFGQEHETVLADLSTQEGVNTLVDAVPSLDGVSLNAGIVKTLPIAFVNSEDLQAVLDTNLIGTTMLTQRLLKKKKLHRGSSVVFTSSIGGVKSFIIGNAMYDISKGGLNALMKVAALELAPKGIRCNSVNPGMVDSNILASGTISAEQLAKHTAKYPLKRYGKPEEVAHAIIYLLSDASSWVTGTALVIDGGITLI